MAIVTTDNQYYSAIAIAIRNKAGVETTYKPADMAAAIAAIPSGGGESVYVPYVETVIPTIKGYKYEVYKGSESVATTCSITWTFNAPTELTYYLCESHRQTLGVDPINWTVNIDEVENTGVINNTTQDFIINIPVGTSTVSFSFTFGSDEDIDDYVFFCLSGTVPDDYESAVGLKDDVYSYTLSGTSTADVNVLETLYQQGSVEFTTQGSLTTTLDGEEVVIPTVEGGSF